MKTVTPRRRNPRGQGDRLRDDLIETTLALLSDAGDPEDVSIRAVAKATGVTPTAVYRHFADRDDLIVAACETNFDRFATFLQERFDAFEDPFERFRAAGDAYLAFAEEDPGRYRVLFSNPYRQTIPRESWPADLTTGDRAFVAVVQLIRDCIDAGARPTSEDPTYLGFQVWTWMHGIADLRITHPQFPWPPATQMLADLAAALGLDRPAD